MLSRSVKSSFFVRKPSTNEIIAKLTCCQNSSEVQCTKMYYIPLSSSSVEGGLSTRLVPSCVALLESGRTKALNLGFFHVALNITLTTSKNYTLRISLFYNNVP